RCLVADTRDRPAEDGHGDAGIARDLLDVRYEAVEHGVRAVREVAAEDRGPRAPGQGQVARALHLDVALARGGDLRRSRAGEQRRDVSLDVVRGTAVVVRDDDDRPTADTLR